MFSSCLKDINFNTTLNYPDFFIGEQSEERYMALCSVSQKLQLIGKAGAIFRISRSNIP
jgi:hypothetical protein